jgi:uncharacterized protein (TIGR03083 family)
MIHVETEPRRSALDRPTAARLAATEYDRYLDTLRLLPPADWARPTDCPAWDVRAIAAHCLGMAEYAASPEEQQRQVQAAARRGGVFIDALTGLQVQERAGLTPAELIARYAEVCPRAARARAAAPDPVRESPMPVPQTVNGVAEWWAIGFLLDTVLTRDTWMHRIDTARATGRAPELTADHDGVLVADVVAEWGERHGGSCALTLTGPAGGRWTFGSGGPALELDAVEFARILSGRRPVAARLPFDTEVPF